MTALGALLALLAIAAPAGAATLQQRQEGAFAVAPPSGPFQDLVVDHPTRALARARADAPLARVPVNDGAGRSVDIQVSVLCQATCDAADPQTIANFLGTLPHGDEMNQLTLMLVKPAAEMAAQCGSTEALSCYFPSENLIVASGDSFTASDNATQLYVIAHEYGHHVANHRNNSPFGNPSTNYGPKNWASWAGVCAGVRGGRYVPGDEGNRYYDNPGEAWAESFAHNAFPNSGVPWEWPDFPDPHTGAFPQIQKDALTPWTGDHSVVRKGHFGRKRRARKQTKALGTPLDGQLTVTLKGPKKVDLGLKLKGPDGGVVARSDGLGSHEQVQYTVCGQRSFTAVVRRHGHHKARYKLVVQEP